MTDGRAIPGNGCRPDLDGIVIWAFRWGSRCHRDVGWLVAASGVESEVAGDMVFQGSLALFGSGVARIADEQVVWRFASHGA